ncbi:anti-sigma factor family protein [Compostibacter hankyongensis]
MHDELLNILKVKDGCPSQQQLLDYLNGRLPPDQQHEVELHVADCALCSDALEGLSDMRHREQLPAIVRQIHAQLQRELRSHQRKNKRQKYYVWLSAVIFILLLILIIAFFAIHYAIRHSPEHTLPGQDSTRTEAPLENPQR